MWCKFSLNGLNGAGEGVREMRFLKAICWMLAALCLLTERLHENGSGFQKPDAVVSQPEHFQYAPRKAEGTLPEDRWWEVFNDPEINGWWRRC
jgi:hypothetical protein